MAQMRQLNVLGSILHIHNSIFVYQYTWDFVTRGLEKTSRNIRWNFFLSFAVIPIVFQEFDNKGLLFLYSCLILLIFGNKVL